MESLKELNFESNLLTSTSMHTLAVRGVGSSTSILNITYHNPPDQTGMEHSVTSNAPISMAHQ